jgi:NADH-quinone oxidoreductase subunit L
LDVAGVSPRVALYLDGLSLLMVLVITIVGFLIHLYSAEYMIDDEAYCRFFAYMNLFVASMLLLVLADNLAVLYVGWEGVGLCSYLLIGFWYRDPANARAAIKAFVTTRIGDTAMLLGIFVLFASFGTLDIQTILVRARLDWTAGTAIPILTAALLLGGALGKSAQLPLQTWLPDAMAGPTPVSALIHAATMVTAGVYLIARTNTLFVLAPPVQAAVAVIGVLTLILAGCAALVQYDIKRVLAYSTISQIGYMFLALGVGAWSAAMFHFMTHAVFKALLFLAAGAVIISAHHEQNMFLLGGLRNALPVTFWTFLAGAASLASVPLITCGFYSKDLILWYAWGSPLGGPWLWAGALFGAVITALYTFRMVFLTFFGRSNAKVEHAPGVRIHVPLIVLAVLSLTVGLLELPHHLGGVPLFSSMLGPALPAPPNVQASMTTELLLQMLAAGACILGIAVAYLVYLARPTLAENLAENSLLAFFRRWWFQGWGFDALYDLIIIRPFVAVARANRDDVMDLISLIPALVAQSLHGGLSYLQNGRVRTYALGIAVAAVLAAGVVVVL